MVAFPVVPEKSLFDELGGEVRLRQIIDRFVDKVCDDTMIGFFFVKVDRARLKQREYEFAARHLGADVEYTGRPIDVAHAPHPIMGGQFMRRLRLLEETLSELSVPARVRAHWVEHTLGLRSLVTRDAGSDCDADAARARVDEHLASRRARRDEEGH